MLIVGNLGEDAFVTADWSNPQKLATEIKRAGMRQADRLSKAVTHLVVSRRAFRDREPEGKSTQIRLKQYTQLDLEAHYFCSYIYSQKSPGYEAQQEKTCDCDVGLAGRRDYGQEVL